ncbi:phosphoenolpyruvate--protein phosphotransferase [Candidatus Albibeggiatoa sp. nov. NOAA]|uniref:phosphoenolpyruvate--protein phosphotransferase n=1 Tax=Candidatus Albibeggiatoa sp. nov. NOAA TaxID=3162724 RepID=UPI0032FB2273|nr:phosphoenolpyruvate--protein phosphotransferase [Thiotrichaceae bacterium]
MSFTLKGIGVSKGIAIGKIHIIDHDTIEVNEYTLSKQSLDDEVARFEDALVIARQQLQKIQKNIPKTAPEDVVTFIETHLLMLNDSLLVDAPIQFIKEKQCNAEWALKLQCDYLVKVFDEMDDPYISSRKRDVEQVVSRIQHILRGHTELPSSTDVSNAIVVADDLTPADTILMQHQGILGFATEYGGTTSHTAILARSLGIPAIVGLHRARRYVKPDDTLILDGIHGVMLVAPDQRTVEYYEQKQKQDKQRRTALKRLKQAPCVTLDGQEIKLHTNIEFPEDMSSVKKAGSNGVGLYRTEFLFMNRIDPPDEAEHYAAYLKVVKSLKHGEVTIRTVDLGGDKQANPLHAGSWIANPALGLRAIRLCLKNMTLFKQQLRAILRVSAEGNVRMMIPMLSGLQELTQVLNVVEETRRELSQEGFDFDPNMPVGAMVEVPAMAVCTDLFLPYLDFLSIGTNDLIQYTLAIDRCDDSVNYLYDPLHPAILRLIKMSIDGAQNGCKPISMCGEMASDTRYVRLLLGLGLRAFSVNPEAFLEVKQIINNTDINSLHTNITRMLSTDSPTEMRYLLDKMNT